MTPGKAIRDDRYEAGHQFEWVWLLFKKARLQNQVVAPFVKGLIKKGVDLHAADGRIPPSHHLSGAPRESYMRTWGITEAIKAYGYLTRLGFGVGDYTNDLQKVTRFYLLIICEMAEVGLIGLAQMESCQTLSPLRPSIMSSSLSRNPYFNMRV